MTFTISHVYMCERNCLVSADFGRLFTGLRQFGKNDTEKMTVTRTSFWLAVLHTEDLGVVGLHLQDLLQAVKVVNPAGTRSRSELSSQVDLEKVRPLLPSPTSASRCDPQTPGVCRLGSRRYS